jgi:biotin---protein ligase
VILFVSPANIMASHPLPQFLTSNPSTPSAVTSILDSLASPHVGSQLIEFVDKHDTFCFYPFSDRQQILCEARSQNLQERPIQSIIVCLDGQLPEHALTPFFDLALYYQVLSETHKPYQIPLDHDTWTMGDVLLYGETVTSTQTMLEKYVNQ